MARTTRHWCYEPVDGVLTPEPANLSIYGTAGAMVSTLDDMRVCAESLATGSLVKPGTRVSGSKVLGWRRDRFTTVMRSASARRGCPTASANR